jgi:hypothetical protein
MKKLKKPQVILLQAVILVAATSGGRVFAQAFSTATGATLASESASIGALSISRQTLSPTSSASAQALPRVFAPTMPRTTYTRYPWKTDITATVFWVGEGSTAASSSTNYGSSWDATWQQTYGGFDDPDRRAEDFRPASFVPKQNPFYVALPYNDCLNSTSTKKDAAKVVPWFRQLFKKPGQSVCRDHWIAVRHGDRICYAQWSDCGPFLTDDVNYVFGDARPSNPHNDSAGLDISPSVRDYLGFHSGDKCDWRFVDVNEVPDGPWKSYGQNNHFVQNVGKEKDLVVSRLEELRRQRDEWFKKNGNASLIPR